MDEFKFHDMKLTWLNGGVNFLDGGTMFGVVPKALWSRRYEVNENNLIELTDRSNSNSIRREKYSN